MSLAELYVTTTTERCVSICGIYALHGENLVSDPQPHMCQLNGRLNGRLLSRATGIESEGYLTRKWGRSGVAGTDRLDTNYSVKLDAPRTRDLDL